MLISTSISVASSVIFGMPTSSTLLATALIAINLEKSSLFVGFMMAIPKSRSSSNKPFASPLTSSATIAPLTSRSISSSPSASTQYGPSRPTKAWTFEAPMVINVSSFELVSTGFSVLRGRPNVSSNSLKDRPVSASKPPPTATVRTGPNSKAKLPVI